MNHIAENLPDEQYVTEAVNVAVKCLSCGMDFIAKRKFLLERWILPSLCDTCADLRDNRIDEWAAICPLEFRLPAERGGKTNLQIMDAKSPGWRGILEWQFGNRGLLIRGESGRCKTRAMWRLIRRLFNERRKVIALTSAQFDRQCRDAGGSFNLTAWFDRLAKCDVLFLDDLGKAAWTAGTEAQVFDLIDERTREGRPILCTTNDDGQTLAARLSDNRGDPLIRRLREYCESVVL
jgi:hypothetical protein